MNNWIIILIILLSAVFLTWSIMALSEWYFLRKKYGPVIFYIKLPALKIPFRSKYIYDFNLDLQTIERYIREYFNIHYKYYDRSILKNMVCVFEEDLYGGFNNSVHAIGSADINTIFYFTKLARLRVTQYNLSEIEKRAKEKRFTSVDLAQLILHEYLHHFSYENYNNVDSNHIGNCWKTIR